MFLKRSKMKKMNSALGVMAVLLLAGAAAHAQVAPAATRPALPVNGNLHYDLRFSETAQFDGSQGDQQWSMVSGDASYANTGKRYPFTLQYGGGYDLPWAGQSSTGNVFQHLSLSQGFIGRAWNLNAGDNVSYSFETPTVGFSGVPGSGGSIGDLGSTSSSDQSILALNTRSLDNTAMLSASRRLDRATSLNLGGTWGELLYIDNNGLNTDTLTANAGVSRRLDAHNSIAGEYSFSRYSYSKASLITQTNIAQCTFTRQWNRRLSTTASLGPEWLASSGLPSTSGIAMPNSTALFIAASASYQLRRESAGAIYSHGTNNGSGYFLGAKIDTVNGNFSREFGRNMTVGATGSYSRTTALIKAELIFETNGSIYIEPLNFAGQTNSRFAGAQATRQLGRYISIFANYTAIDQSSNWSIAQLGNNVNLISGLYQVVGFGIGYSPREIHLRR